MNFTISTIITEPPKHETTSNFLAHSYLLLNGKNYIELPTKLVFFRNFI